MKPITFLLIFIASTAAAQWSNTTNLFTDSMHTLVCNASNNQSTPLIVRSYPDSGYFVIWQDARNSPYSDDTKAIYAQKYDKTGKALWAANGVPASSSTRNQHYTYQGQDYRNRSFAATDSAGGFYITYADDSDRQRVCVQHYKSNGTTVFGSPGYIIYTDTAGGATYPQLVADGNGGFFVSFVKSVYLYNSSSPDYLYVLCYKDVNGAMQYYGGGVVNENAVQNTISSSACGNYTTLSYPAAVVGDYMIFSDLQGGCNVVMYVGVNSAQGGAILGYNKLFRAKQNYTAVQHYLDIHFGDSTEVDNYTAGNVYRLYYLRTDHQEITCGGGDKGDLYTVNQYRLVQNGFQEIDGANTSHNGQSLYDLNDMKGVTVHTAGNINATMIGTWERTYSTSVSDPYITGYGFSEEIFDAVPYQRTSDAGESANYPGYNTAVPASMNKLGYFRDTLLAGTSGYDFSLTGGGNQIFSAGAAFNEAPYQSDTRVQHIAVEKQSADSFAFVYKTSGKVGELIGTAHSWDVPYFAVNNNGNALFYVYDNAKISSIRVSPLFSGASLAWGAMGKLTGTGVWNGSYYYEGNPVVSLDPANGTAVIAWTTSNRGTTGNDIYMRHLDSLNKHDYEPPYLPVRNAAGNASATLPGTSNNLTTFEVDNGGVISPVADISDNYNLGNVNISVYQNNPDSSVRTTSNGTPYLNRSWTITPDNNPNGAATVTIRLFFTNAEFNALKAADTSPYIRREIWRWLSSRQALEAEALIRLYRANKNYCLNRGLLLTADIISRYK